jgi:glycosyltransferase involved in cell wall biosynthesis
VVVTGLPPADGIDREAESSFARCYGHPDLGPITVVIPAFEEEGSIGAVVSRVPAQVRGHPVRSLVVVDGGSDGTAQVAADHGAFVCQCPVNRGQGATIRLGYRVALDHGARWLVTIDADGQYDPAEAETVLAPVIAKEADVVLGSRRLGRNETGARLRTVGVHAFAVVISLLFRQRLTDSSSGFRALSAEVAATVRLEQRQYQSAEFLISALSHRFRVIEVPITMRPRLAGRTKKGNDLSYGLRYAGVIWTTWRRDRRLGAPGGAHQ